MNNDKLKKAIIYVDRIANGYNPVNNSLALNDSVLNNPNVVRCMFFIKDVLQDVYNNGGVIGKKSKLPKEPFNFVVLQDFHYVEDKSITNFFRQINQPIQNTNMENIKCKPVIDWLKTNDYLSVQYDDNFSHGVTVVTHKGANIGLYNETRVYNGREYLAVLYSEKAQNFIVKNLEAIMHEISTN